MHSIKMHTINVSNAFNKCDKNAHYKRTLPYSGPVRLIASHKIGNYSLRREFSWSVQQSLPSSC